MNTLNPETAVLGLVTLSDEEMANVDGGALPVLAAYLIKGAVVAVGGALIGYAAAELLD